MAARNYSNTGSDAEVAVLVGAADTSTALANYSGFPSYPYIAAFDPDTVDEEIVLVTNVSGSTVTMTRAYDGTTAKSHAAGAVFRHVASAVDFQDANNHVNATTGVHGVTGSPVGTTDTQTLTNKTLTSPTISAPTVTGTMTAAAAAFSGSVTVAVGSITTLTAGSASVTGTLGVTGLSTLAGLSATDVNATTVATTGAVTVGGTLGVTGAATLASAAVTGALTAATVDVVTAEADEIELVQAASDLTPATGRSSLYARTDFGLYFTPATQSRRRASMHWGSGATLPTTGVIEGDTFYATTVTSLLRYNGTDWRQIDGPVQIANMAARPGTTAVGLHAGFQVFSLVDDETYTYDGTYWRNDGTCAFVPSGAGAGDYITAVIGSTVATTDTGGLASIAVGHTYSAIPGYVNVNLASIGSGGVRYVNPIPSGHTTSTFRVMVFQSDGTVMPSEGFQVYWQTIGYNN